MTGLSVAIGTCDLCQEIGLGGTAVTGTCVGNEQRPGYSRLIRRTSVVDVLAGLWVGYTWLCPAHAQAARSQHRRADNT